MLPAIEAHHLSKKYSLRQDRHRSHAVSDIFREILGRRRRDQGLREDEFLAVEDLSFEVAPGEAVALIGRNGCGKSTTLKMVAGLIKPDAGHAVVRGRLQALISLGTGFNPKLTGRENLFNGAAIQGFNARATRAIIDEVIEFAEIGEFIDSPYATYSSGMRARLGFSLAVQMRPDVLVVDEILGVGDFAFQNKCHGRMNELRRNGTTIVLVSHNHNRVIQMCERALWLHRGHLVESGPADETVKAYLAYMERQEAAGQSSPSAAGDAGEATNGKRAMSASPRRDPELFGERLDEHPRVRSVEVEIERRDRAGDPITIHSPVRICVDVHLADKIGYLNVNLPIYRADDGLHLTKLSTQDTQLLKGIHEGSVRFAFDIDDLNLAVGDYVLCIAVFDGQEFIYRDIAKEFHIGRGDGIYFTKNLVDLSCDQRILTVDNQSLRDRPDRSGRAAQ